MENRSSEQIFLITGTRTGVGRALAEHYVAAGHTVVGCSRQPSDFEHDRYSHETLDVGDERAVKDLLRHIRKIHGRLDVLINNAGVASMNHVILTPVESVSRVLKTNVIGTFLFCREAAKLMKKRSYGRIVNVVTVAMPLRLEGEAIYASSKAAVLKLTHILARELAEYGITVNAVGPGPIETDLIAGVPKEKLRRVIERQAIKRHGELRDVINVTDFFLRPQSDFITAQVLYLGGV